MKKMEIIKGISSLAVSVGVVNVISKIAKSAAPAGTNPIIKICTTVGTFVISSMITDKAAEYTDKKIDDTVDSLKKAVADKVI